MYQFVRYVLNMYDNRFRYGEVFLVIDGKHEKLFVLKWIAGVGLKL